MSQKNFTIILMIFISGAGAVLLNNGFGGELDLPPPAYSANELLENQNSGDLLQLRRNTKDAEAQEALEEHHRGLKPASKRVRPSSNFYATMLQTLRDSLDELTIEERKQVEEQLVKIVQTIKSKRATPGANDAGILKPDGKDAKSLLNRTAPPSSATTAP